MEKEKSQNSSHDSIKVLSKSFLGVILGVILAGTIGYYIYNDIAITSDDSEDIVKNDKEIVTI
ncbi:hypothetical protein IID10_00800, partial [candidate division KSB1 bacterium]|nr:hypothetical protein [candidate division KSB1 bacterium]